MEKDKVYQNLVDLHMHLGSSSAPHFLWEIAHKQGIKLPTKDYWEFINSITINEKKTYEQYLDYFHLTELIQSSLFAVERAVYHALSLLYRKSNITLLEIRFNPMLRNNENEHDLDKIILAAIIGMKKASLDYPIKAGIILMMDRRFDSKLNNIIAEKAVFFKDDGVVGLDLGGPLRHDFKIDEVAPAFRLGRKKGLKSTFHTGEVTGVDEMWEVMDKIAPERIGHGVKAVEDKKLLQHLAKEKTVLEICPTSNIKTSVFRNWESFRSLFAKLDQENVLYTINSDGPVFLKTTVMDEFKKLLKHNIIKKQDIVRLTEVAREASFVKK
jgi:adenosine deaminase